MVRFAALFSGERNLVPVISPLKVVILAASNDTNISDSGCCNSSKAISPSIPFVILLLFCFFILICVFFSFSRRRSTNWERTRERGSGHNIMEVLNWQAARGLDRAVIESFPVFSYSLMKGLKGPAKCSDCAVCLTEFQEEEMLRLLPQCGHAFHPECIDSWLFSNTSCPVCRTSLLLADDSVFNPTDFGLIEPQRLLEELTVVIDNGGEVSFLRDASNADGAKNGDPNYSSVREDQPMKWYIATAEGLTPGMHKKCSFVGDAGHVSTSERWGRISMNPASVLRTFSERISIRAIRQVGVEEEHEWTS